MSKYEPAEEYGLFPQEASKMCRFFDALKEDEQPYLVAYILGMRASDIARWPFGNSPKNPLDTDSTDLRQIAFEACLALSPRERNAVFNRFPRDFARLKAFLPQKHKGGRPRK